MKKILALLALSVLAVGVLFVSSCDSESASAKSDYDMGPTDYSTFTEDSIEALIEQLTLIKTKGREAFLENNPSVYAQSNASVYEIQNIAALNELIYPTALCVDQYQITEATVGCYDTNYYYMPIQSNSEKAAPYNDREGISLTISRETFDDIDAQMASLAAHYKAELREDGTVYRNTSDRELLSVPYENTYYTVSVPAGMFTPEELLELFQLDVYDLIR